MANIFVGMFMILNSKGSSLDYRIVSDSSLLTFVRGSGDSGSEQRHGSPEDLYSSSIVFLMLIIWRGYHKVKLLYNN